MKEHIRHIDLSEIEELYFYEQCLYSGDVERIEAWQNGRIPPSNEIRRAQIEGMSRRFARYLVFVFPIPLLMICYVYMFMNYVTL